MKLTAKYMTRNDCYAAGKKIKPSGIMIHSTATPGVMAAAWFNSWNKSYAKGEMNRQVCVHAFLDDKEVWQYLPWDHRAWHAGGDANNTHIGIEICEPAGFKYSGGSTMSGYDVAKHTPYFRAAWQNAVELCVMLCRQYGLTEKKIICHCEGAKSGVASNHADVLHWFPKHGENMDTFRAAVKTALAGSGENADTGSSNTQTADGEGILFRVRKAWSDNSSQKGAFTNLINAIACADKNPSYCVFDDKGTRIHPPVTGEVDKQYVTYIVKKGDTLWTIATRFLGNGARHPEITTLNKLKSGTLAVGQKLLIPEK